MYRSVVPRLVIIILLMTLALGLIWYTGRTLASDDERAVDMASFIAEPLADGSIHLEWSTGSEEDTANFQIIRAVYPNLPTYPTNQISFTVNSNLVQSIPGQGAPGAGAEYLVFDLAVTPGVSYTYIIVEQDTNGVYAVKSDFTRTAQVGDLAEVDVQVSPLTSSLSGKINSPTYHTYTVKNNGNRWGEFIVSQVSSQWQPIMSDVFIALGPGQSKTITATVTVPTTALGCASDTATIKIETEGVFELEDNELFTAKTSLPCIYLPIVVSQ